MRIVFIKSEILMKPSADQGFYHSPLILTKSQPPQVTRGPYFKWKINYLRIILSLFIDAIDLMVYLNTIQKYQFWSFSLIDKCLGYICSHKVYCLSEDVENCSSIIKYVTAVLKICTKLLLDRKPKKLTLFTH